MERLCEKVPQILHTVHAADGCYFVVWTSHGMIIDEMYFDNEFWCSMKTKFQKYHAYFF